MGMPGASPSDVLVRSGWARSVAGSNPYLTPLARAGVGRERVDQAVSNLEIHELPSARGCTYVVPREDFALALRVSLPTGDSAEMRTAKKFLGVTDAEIDHLCERVLDALADGAKDPAAIKEVVGDAARHLGEEGKKRGTITTLPLTLGRLQSHGEIRRQSTNGRLDNQRYNYVRWPDNPLRGFRMTAPEATTELARKYFRWIGPAKAAHFQWFSGEGVKTTKDALAPLGLVPIEAGSDWLIYPDELDSLHAHVPSAEPRYALLSCIDALVLHRRDIASMLDDTDRNRKMCGEKNIYELGAVQDLTCNAIVDRGRLIGLWEYEPSSQSIAWTSFVPPTSELRAAIMATEKYITEDLGDARSFSLDSPASRQVRIDALRASA